MENDTKYLHLLISRHNMPKPKKILNCILAFSTVVKYDSEGLLAASNDGLTLLHNLPSCVFLYTK